MSFSSTESRHEQAPRAFYQYDYDVRPDMDFTPVPSGQFTVVDPDYPLLFAPDHEVVAQIKLYKSLLTVLDVRTAPVSGHTKLTCGSFLTPDEVKFLVVDETFAPGSGNPMSGYRGIRENQTIIVGRNPEYLGRFNFGEHLPYISSRHLSITYTRSGNLLFQDLGSTNGTKIKAGMSAEAPPGQADFLRNYKFINYKDIYKDHDRERKSATDEEDARAKRQQEEAVRRIREQEEAEIKSRQAAQARRNAERARQRERSRQQRAEKSRQRAHSQQEPKESWQEFQARRKREISQLDPEVRKIFEQSQPLKPGRPIIDIPHELSIADAAKLVSEALNLQKQSPLSDARIFRRLTKEHHPDLEQDPDKKTHNELLIKLLGNAYDPKEKRFKFN